MNQLMHLPNGWWWALLWTFLKGAPKRPLSWNNEMESVSPHRVVTHQFQRATSSGHTGPDSHYMGSNSESPQHCTTSDAVRGVFALDWAREGVGVNSDPSDCCIPTNRPTKNQKKQTLHHNNPILVDQLSSPPLLKLKVKQPHTVPQVMGWEGTMNRAREWYWWPQWPIWLLHEWGRILPFLHKDGNRWMFPPLARIHLIVQTLHWPWCLDLIWCIGSTRGGMYVPVETH